MSVGIQYGTYEETADLAGMKISEVRHQYQDPWNIDPASIALVNGKKSSEDHVVVDGEKIEFIRSETKYT